MPIALGVLGVALALWPLALWQGGLGFANAQDPWLFKSDTKTYALAELVATIKSNPRQFLALKSKPQEEVVRGLTDWVTKHVLWPELFSVEAKKEGLDRLPTVESQTRKTIRTLYQKDSVELGVTEESITAQQVQQYYQEHLREFVHPEYRRASYILLRNEKDANDVLAKAKESNLTSFSDLAKSYSIDRETNMQGGDLRYFDATARPERITQAAIPLPVAEAVFSMKTAGTLFPKVVQVGQRFAVVWFVSKREPVEQKVEQVEVSIRTLLLGQAREQKRKSTVQSLKERFKVEVFEARFKVLNVAQAAETPASVAHQKPKTN